jgi:hypothetical protein
VLATAESVAFRGLLVPEQYPDQKVTLTRFGGHLIVAGGQRKEGLVGPSIEVGHPVSTKAGQGQLIGDRDRLILLLGFAGGFGRSELVSLEVDDIEEHPEGLLVGYGRVRPGSAKRESFDRDYESRYFEAGSLK